MAGAVVFLIVWAINYFISYDLLDSLLKALTLAMSILPEEIPMAFTLYGHRRLEINENGHSGKTNENSRNPWFSYRYLYRQNRHDH
ncbi:hypothetical protein [Candidatus Brachybacter algidus]|uniref:hypothetical protein n=1 Tax=Candidatus Brachybacter algidus TaxID=2982024 RepID=UPI00257D9A98|nr:hypothetical protein [Candidatus Brachybacter algidus]